MKTMADALQNRTFSYWKFLIGKVVWLWPMVLIWSLIALIIGLFVMLSDDLENLSESVIASNFFVNNILECITTKNYWDVSNVFKPLMHTWYVDILMQGYVLFPLVYMVVFKLFKGKMNVVKIAIGIITLLSLVAYLLPIASSAQKFYYLPFRAFEFTLGGLVVFVPVKGISRKVQCVLETICLTLVLFLLYANIDFHVDYLKPLLMVSATAVLLYVFVNTERGINEKVIMPVAAIGKASLSIYLCHQVIVAYMFYAVTEKWGL